MIQLLKRRWFAIAFLFMLMSVLAACGAPTTPITSWPGMVIHDNTAYVASSDQIYGIDIATNVDAKRQVWALKSSDVGGAGFHSQPAISDDGKLLYLGTDNATGTSGSIIAIDTDIVTRTWTYPASKDDVDPGSIYGGIVLTNTRLYFVGSKGLLLALDAKTGRPVWNKPFDAGTDTRIWSMPAVSDKLVLFASQDHHIYAVNQTDGSLAWKFPADTATQVGTFAGSPAVYGNMAYIGSFDSYLYALDLEGNLKWKFKAEGRLWDPPALVDGTLYLGDMSGNVYALDAASGQTKWPQSNKVDGGVRATPLVANGKIYIGTDQFKVYALDLDGRFYWQNPFVGKDGEMFVVTPAMISTTLVALPNLAGSTPTRLYGLNASTGARLWSFPPAGQ